MANDNGKGKQALAKMFAIHPDNTAAAYEAGEAPEGSVLFSSEAELMAISLSWPATTLLDIWNRLPGVAPVSKFTDRKTAVRRIWRAITAPKPEEPQRSVPAGKGCGRKAAAKPKRSNPPQPATKTERIIALLRRPEGATLKAIMTATGWQAPSVRGFVSAQLTKRMGLKVKSFKRASERVYRIRP